MQAKQSEANLLRQVTTLLGMHPEILFWRQNLGAVLHSRGKQTVYGKNPMAGFPDLAGITPSGRFFGIELKTTLGKLSPLQKLWSEKLQKNQGLWYLVRSLDEARSVVEFLKQS